MKSLIIVLRSVYYLTTHGKINKIPNYLFIEITIRLPEQFYRYIRWNLFPMKCPKCNKHLVLKYNMYKKELNSREYDWVDSEPIDFLICEDKNCTGKFFLDSNYFEKE